MKPVVISDLTQIYESTGAGLQSFSAEFLPSEWVAILGPSGSGKSTLLRLLAGLEPPLSGTVSTGRKQGEMGFVFQDPALLPWKTVLENVLLPFDLAGHKDETAVARSQEWIHKLKLERFVNRYPRELSGGMKMRVSIARALVTQPSLLLLDEPFAALDEPIRLELGMELRELWKQSNPNVFFVTHSITEALWLADRVIVLQGLPGKIALDEKLPFGLDRPISIRGSSEFQSRVEKCFQLLQGRAT